MVETKSVLLFSSNCFIRKFVGRINQVITHINI